MQTVDTFVPETWVTGSDKVTHTSVTIKAGENLPARTPLQLDAPTGHFVEWQANGGTAGKAVFMTEYLIDASAGAKQIQAIKSGTFNPELVNWSTMVVPTAAEKLAAFIGTPISLQTTA